VIDSKTVRRFDKRRCLFSSYEHVDGQIDRSLGVCFQRRVDCQARLNLHVETFGHPIIRS